MNYKVELSNYKQPKFIQAYELPAYTYGVDEKGRVWFRTAYSLTCLSDGRQSYTEVTPRQEVYLRPLSKGETVTITIE